MKRAKFICLIGNSGYAESAKDYALALRDAGVKVSVEYIDFGQGEGCELQGRTLEMHAMVNNDADVDAVFIYSPPNYWPPYIERFRDAYIIGMTIWETTKIHPDWIPVMNQVDLVVVPCEWNKQVFEESGMTTPVSLVPLVLKDQPEIPSYIKGTEGKYVFYVLGQWNARKAIDDTIRAYLTAFTSKDDGVVLIVKTHWHSFSDSDQAMIKDWIADVMMEFPDPAKIITLTQEQTQTQIEAIHTRGDCFVSCCKSEGWGMGAFDAASRGKPVIITGYGGQLEFLKVGKHHLIPYDLVPAAGMPWIPWYLPEEQQWAQPRIQEAAKLMRRQYRYKASGGQKQADWVRKTFSSERIGNMLSELIQEK